MKRFNRPILATLKDPASLKQQTKSLEPPQYSRLYTTKAEPLLSAAHGHPLIFPLVYYKFLARFLAS